jgi:hypothetical protein
MRKMHAVEQGLLSASRDDHGMECAEVHECMGMQALEQGSQRVLPVGMATLIDRDACHVVPIVDGMVQLSGVQVCQCGYFVERAWHGTLLCQRTCGLYAGQDVDRLWRQGVHDILSNICGALIEAFLYCLLSNEFVELLHAVVAILSLVLPDTLLSICFWLVGLPMSHDSAVLFMSGSHCLKSFDGLCGLVYARTPFFAWLLLSILCPGTYLSLHCYGNSCQTHVKL